MKVQTILFKPPQTAETRYAVTPEMNAAVAARHSRTPEGLDEIMRKVGGMSEAKAVDSIFKFVDYGHQSVLDMIPVSIHFEKVSLFFANMVWFLVKTGGGQEQSTRYNPMQGSDNFLGGETDLAKGYREAQLKAIEIWSEIAKTEAAIPYLGGPDAPEPMKQRLARNFVFDRSRYWIPMTTFTNMNVTTWGREWARICSLLDSAPWAEFREAAELIRAELSISSPRLIRHSGRTDANVAWWTDLTDGWVAVANHYETYERDTDVSVTFEYCEIGKPSQHWKIPRGNRYDPVDGSRRLIPVYYGWAGVSIAEMRDMNRHRPGERMINMCPTGFYCAQDQFAEFGVPRAAYHEIEEAGNVAVEACFNRMKENDVECVYDMPLGAMVAFTHSSTLGNLIYECELRTGPGTHYRYRKHYLDLVEEMKRKLPTIGPMLIGSGEPE